uniref:P2R1A-PPP2R2A-interacting phosphatase regulator 1-like isoform X2 n=1 Tax=Myodes glareolus TaxID=447135 RepID=UPI002020F09D|nr:P2R1A-PPP2R2A-interacting phosphatase regulator 1-like isoform X2 [Myodes glareolus]
MACGGREDTDVSMDEDSDVFLNQQEPDTLQNFQLSSGFVLNTDVAKEKMEVDVSLPQDPTTIDASLFRRSSSIPLINGFGDNSQGFQVDNLRMRRNGSPFLNRHALFLPSRTRMSANRIFQIKQEEKMDIASREAMHEREVHTAIQISQSWEASINLNNTATMQPSVIRSIKQMSISPVTSFTKEPGKVKWSLKISQVKFASITILQSPQSSQLSTKCLGEELS